MKPRKAKFNATPGMKILIINKITPQRTTQYSTPDKPHSYPIRKRRVRLNKICTINTNHRGTTLKTTQQNKGTPPLSTNKNHTLSPSNPKKTMYLEIPLEESCCTVIVQKETIHRHGKRIRVMG